MSYSIIYIYCMIISRLGLNRWNTTCDRVSGFTCVSIVLLLLATFSLYGQSSGTAQPGIDIKSLFENASSSAKSELMDDGKFAADNAINPDFYFVGPGDILSLMIMPVPAAEQPIMITPENTAIIPRIGAVSVKGKTLSQARDTIITILKQRNPNAAISLSLRKSRIVYVTVNGNVRYPGVFTFPASTRVSTVVRMAQQRSPNGNSLEGTQKQEDAPNRELNRILERPTVQGINPYSARNIRVFHNDGTANRADFERARFFTDTNDDPTIREGDEIFVPYAPSSYPTISISGAVRRPTVLAYREGDKSSFLFKAGMGLNENADPTSIEGFGVGSNTQSFALNAKGELSSDIELTPGYAIVAGELKKNATSSAMGVVEVVGEVQKPGTYSVTSYQTRLRDIISKAGGFTSEAYLPLAYVLIRDQDRYDTKVEEAKKLLQHTDLGVEDTSRFLLHNNQTLPYASCDIARCFSEKNPSESDNIVLRDGDIIVIPKNPKRVFVYGQVLNSGYVVFEPGKNHEWYIKAAGGYSTGAVESRTRIIKGRTKTWIEATPETVLEAGDALYVPPPAQNPPGYDIQFLATVAALATSAIFLITSVVNFFYR